MERNIPFLTRTRVYTKEAYEKAKETKKDINGNPVKMSRAMADERNGMMYQKRLVAAPSRKDAAIKVANLHFGEAVEFDHEIVHSPTENDPYMTVRAWIPSRVTESFIEITVD